MADATTIGVRGAEPAETTRHDGTDLTLAIQLAEQRASALRGGEQCAHRARVNRVEGAAEVLHRGQRATRVLGQYLPVDERIRVSLKDSRFNAQEDLRGALRCVVDKHYHGEAAQDGDGQRGYQTRMHERDMDDNGFAAAHQCGDGGLRTISRLEGEVGVHCQFGHSGGT